MDPQELRNKIAQELRKRANASELILSTKSAQTSRPAPVREPASPASEGSNKGVTAPPKLDTSIGQRRSMTDVRSLRQREQIFGSDFSDLAKQLRPIQNTTLARKISPCASHFEIMQDPNENYWVILQTGPGNTFDLSGLDALSSLTEVLAAHFEAFGPRIIYLTHKQKDFSLGGDRQSFLNSVETEDYKEIKQIGLAYCNTLRKMSNFPGLFIGVAYGNAQGGGMELLLAMDLQFVWPRVKLGFPEIRSGLIAGMGGLTYLSALIGNARAMRLNLSGELITSEEAFAMGMISHLSETPFADALSFGTKAADLEAAVVARNLTAPPKFALLEKDIEAWVDLVCDGAFLDKKDVITSHFDLISEMSDRKPASAKSRN